MAQFGYKPRGVAAALRRQPQTPLEELQEAQARNAQLGKEAQRLRELLAAERARADELKEWEQKLKEKEQALKQRDEDSELVRLRARYQEEKARCERQDEELEELGQEFEALEEELEQEKARAQEAVAQAAALRQRVEELTLELRAYRAAGGEERPDRKKRTREPPPPEQPPPRGARAEANRGAADDDEDTEQPPEQPADPRQPSPADDEAFAAAKPPAIDHSLSVPVLRQFLTQAGADAQLRLCTEKEELIALASQRLNAWHVRRAAACSRLPAARGDRALFWLGPGCSGVSKKELAKAHRELRLRLHPDKNPGDALATAAFQYLQDAHARMRAAAGA